ncbi:hypothetical protein AM586_25115 [Massilia sp. WG5]|nr:hypothetical protein AM586_25115 [Massilia sp. WG5]
MIFHLSRGINSKAKCEKAKDTLLGRTNIFSMTDSTWKPCYFFRHSDFFRHKHAFECGIKFDDLFEPTFSKI